MNGIFGVLGEGRLLRRLLVGAGVLSLATVAIGMLADRYATTGELSLTAWLEPSGAAQGARPRAFNAIDYATTGSIKGKSQLVVIGPCGPEAPAR